LNATVIPPPVSGCRIFIASPRRIIPGVLFVVAGRKELGIEGRRSASIAFLKEGWTSLGRSGRTISCRYPLRAPDGGSLGMATNARVSCVPIW